MRIVLVIALVITVSGSTASADDSIQFLNVGLITSASVGRQSMAGVGVEATLTSFTDDGGFGGFVQAETGGRAYDDAASLLDQKRYAAGFMVLHGWWGVEVGGLYRTAPALDPTFGVQAGIFASAGILSIEARAGIAPPGTDDHPRYGSDVGIVVATKFPMQVGGAAFTIKDTQFLPCIWRCRPKP